MLDPARAGYARAGEICSAGALPVSVADAAHGAAFNQHEAGGRDTTRQDVLYPSPAQRTKRNKNIFIVTKIFNLVVV